MAESPQALAARAARDLRLALRLDLFVAIFLAAGVVLLLRETAPAWARAAAAWSLCAGLVAVYYSLRLRFDARVFGRWAASADIEAQMRAFDEDLRRRFPTRTFPARPLAERIDGAMRLRRLRGRWCSLQGLAILAAVLPLHPLLASR